MEDSRGTLCRDRRLFGTFERLRCGWAGQDREILRGFRLKVGQVTRKTFEARIRELVTGQATLGRIAEAMLSARATLQAAYEKLHKAVLAFVREDAVCRRLMTVPGVGPVVAVTFKSGGGRSEPDREVEGDRSAVRADTEEVSVG